jgi:hypothetical protein
MEKKMLTYGYDYSFGLKIEKINDILKNNLAGTDITLEYQDKDKETGSVITIKAKMAPWQIIKGGSNTLVRFSLPILQGTMTVEGPAISGQYDLAGVSAAVEVSLAWVGPGGMQQLAGSGDKTELIFSPENTTSPDNPGYISFVSLNDPDNKLDTVGKGLFRVYLIDTLVKNKTKINYLLAKIFPDNSNMAGWLKPFKWIYFYNSSKAQDALCFLCMLSDKEWPIKPAFESAAFSNSVNAVILVSQEVFFCNVILPAIKKSFPDGKFHIDVSNEKCTLKNSEKFSVKTSKGSITTSSFVLTESDSGNGLVTDASGSGPLKFLFGLADLPDASYNWSCRTSNPLNFSNNKVTFLVDKNPTIDHDQTIKWYDWLLLVVVGITSLPGLISVIVDSINKFSDQVSEIGMGNINDEFEKSIGGSVVNLASFISWHTGNQEFSPANARLEGAFYVTGNVS